MLYAQQDQRTETVRAVAQQYFEAWYTGDGEQMEQLLHPKLAKRGIIVREGRETELNDMSALKLVQSAEKGGGSNTPDSLKKKEIVVLSVNNDIASVKIDGRLLTEYLQLIRWKGEWKIINLLWEIKPRWREQWNYG